MICCVENKKHLALNSIFGKYDPTKTTTIRLAFMRDIKKRFKLLVAEIKKVIIEEDFFLLQGKAKVNVAFGKNQFAFPTAQDKISAFMDWLKELEKKNILEVKTFLGSRKGIESQWTDKYIQMTYEKGIQRARQEMLDVGLNIPSFSEMSIQLAFRQPYHLDRVGVIYGRVFSELRGVTAAMDTQISRVLAEGMLQGLGAREIARNIVNAVEMSIGRATTMARTEIIRAHHLANVNEYRQYGIEEVEVKAEWSTVGDERVCPLCEEKDGKIYPLDIVEGLIPLHPNCRCMVLPALKV